MTEDYSDWSEFVTKHNAQVRGSDIYSTFQLFKKHTASLPKSELLKLGWISEEKGLFSMTRLFKELLSGENKALYRKSGDKNIRSSVWLSKIKSSADMSLVTNNISAFDGISRGHLKNLAKMSTDVQIIKRLPQVLAELGIILVYERTLPSTKLDGVVFMLESGHPVVGLSLRYSRLDYFWFTLMHELAHICLHYDHLGSPILDDLETTSSNKIEVEADRLSKSSFVERSKWRNCEPKYDNSVGAIERFAEQVGVHRSIIAGLLRHELGNYSLHGKLVNEFDVRGIIFDDE